MSITVNNAIKQLRNDAGITQENTAIRTGITLRYYQDIESGEKRPSLEVLFALSMLFDVHPGDILNPAWQVYKKAC